MLCPKDMKPCIDDLCYGGGCIECDGAPMYHLCDGCGQPISDEDFESCTCEPYYEDDHG